MWWNEVKSIVLTHRLILQKIEGTEMFELEGLGKKETTRGCCVA